MQLPIGTLIFGALVLALTGCALEPDVGPLQAERCTNADSDPAIDVSYTRDIVPLFERPNGGCVQCHTPGGANPVGISVGGLNMASYEGLLQGGARTSNDIVVEGQPCSSALYLKLTSAPFGGQMPADGPPFWTPDEIRLIADWISEGANNN